MIHSRGSGTISSALGVLVTLVLLLFAVQLIFDLYATSQVTGAAHDAARAVAGYDSQADRRRATAQATADLRRRLEHAGARSVRIDWTLSDPAVVAVRVRTVHPSILPPNLSGRTPLGRLDRTIVVRAEDR